MEYRLIVLLVSHIININWETSQMFDYASLELLKKYRFLVIQPLSSQFSYYEMIFIVLSAIWDVHPNRIDIFVHNIKLN